MFGKLNRKDGGVRPQVRSEKLVFQELNDELLIYNLETDQAHSLNGTAKFVWELCDGDRSIDSIQQRFIDEFGEESTNDAALSAIQQFQDAGLLASRTVLSSRREMIKKTGAVAAAVPVVMSIAVPAAAQMTSCVANGGMCANDAECCSNFCVDDGFCVDPDLREIDSIQIKKVEEDVEEGENR